MKNQVLGLMVIMLLLIVGTNQSFAQDTEIQAKGKQEVITQKKADAKKASHKRQLDVWKKRLDLTNDQVATFESYLSEYMASVQDVKSNTDLSPEEKKMKTKELRKAYDARFRSHLSESQQAKFDIIRGTKRQIQAKENQKSK